MGKEWSICENKKASEIFKSIQDWRQENKISISIHDAMISGLACMYFQSIIITVLKTYRRRTA